jgi:integrase
MARKDGKNRGIFERDGQWWIRWSCRYGHDHRERIGPKGLATAEYQQRKVAVKTQGYCLTRARQDKPMLFRDAATRYLTWAKEQRPRSYTFREKALEHLKATFGDKTLAEITRTDVDTYQTRRRDEGAAPGTVNRERAVLSHLFSKANAWGVVKGNPVTGSDRQKEPDEKPRPVTPDEEARLFAVLPRGKRGFRYWRELVTLALHTGLRLNELREQAWRNIDLPGGSLSVTQPKSGKAETIPLNATARTVLASVERKAPVIFPTLPKKLTDLFIRYAEKAKLTDVTFHCLRDTYISRLAPHVSTPTLMALARQRDYRTTRRYVQVDGDHLRAAVERLNSEATGTQTGTTELTVSQLLETIDVAEGVE